MMPFCEQANEPSGSIHTGNFLKSNYKLFKKRSCTMQLVSIPSNCHVIILCSSQKLP
jgi:hypothetical protein